MISKKASNTPILDKQEEKECEVVICDGDSKSKSKIYIAGETNCLMKQQEQEKAHYQAVEDRLKALGYDEVVNPFKTKSTFSTPWEKQLAREILLLHGCSEVYMLSGWEHSIIASICRFVANLYGMKITYEQEPHFSHIKQAIYDGMGVTFNEIVSRNRNQKIFFARIIFSHLCNTVENATIRSIAEEMKRDHSTILYHLKRYEYDIIYTPEFKRYAEAVKQNLNTLINELQRTQHLGSDKSN